MFTSDALTITPAGHLAIGGCDTLELAQTFGTPLYVMDEASIRDALRAYKASLDAHYPGGGTVAYASKACSFKEMYRIVMQEGCAVDVVSGGELYTALSVGFPAAQVFFHGNNKTADELRYALSAGVGHIVVDNLTELALLSRLAGEMGKTADILLRVTPGIDAHTHDFIATGKIDSKFGFTLENGDATRAAAQAAATPGVRLRGVHCHIGSQIFDEQPFEKAAEVMLTFMAQVRKDTGVTMPVLNLGGGFGVIYTPADNPKAYGEYMALVAATLHRVAGELDFPVPHIVIEPGRSVVGTAGITLYTVGGRKEIPGVRTYVSVDGGMTDNPRYALYKAAYTVLNAGKVIQAADDVVTVAGRCCESGDLIQEQVAVADVQPGDTLAVLTTGAYNYAMSMHYNRLPKPAVVMVRDGEARVAVRRETYEDVARCDV